MNPLGLTSNFFSSFDEGEMEEARQAGFANVEVVFKRAYQGREMIDQADKARRAALQAGLCPASAHLPFGKDWDPANIDADARGATLAGFKDILRVVGAWGIPLAVLHASFGAILPQEREEKLAISCRSIRELSAFAKAVHVTLCVENLPRTALGNTADEVLRLTDCGRVAPVCFDFNHLLQETHAEFIGRVGALIATTHISDYDRVDEKHWLPGEGVIDFYEAVSLLKGCGYQGQLLFEFNREKALPGKTLCARDVARRWQTLMEEAR